MCNYQVFDGVHGLIEIILEGEEVDTMSTSQHRQDDDDDYSDDCEEDSTY